MKKILIVEDDTLISGVYATRFRAEGFEVSVAADGQAAIERLRSNLPDILLLDLQIPKISGIDVLKRIRSTLAMKNLPVIVFTNTHLPELTQEAWRAGANSFLRKAECTPKSVVNVVQKLLAQPLGTQFKPGSDDASDTPVIVFREAHDLLRSLDPSYAKPAPQPENPEQFLEEAPRTLGRIRQACEEFLADRGNERRILKLREFHSQVRSLTANAGMVGFHRFAVFCSAFEALLKHLIEVPGDLKASVERTLSQAADFLAVLTGHIRTIERQTPSASRILLVDDDEITLKIISLAMENAGLKAATACKAAEAMAMINQEKFSVIFLDVLMPGTDGFAICKQLRSLETNAKTPVVFITSLVDYETRARSLISGGTDFVTKPFVPMELTVKAFIRILENQLAGASMGSPGA